MSGDGCGLCSGLSWGVWLMSHEHTPSHIGCNAAQYTVLMHSTQYTAHTHTHSTQYTVLMHSTQYTVHSTQYSCIVHSAVNCRD